MNMAICDICGKNKEVCCSYIGNGVRPNYTYCREHCKNKANHPIQEEYVADTKQQDRENSKADFTCPHCGLPIIVEITG